jgi:hypothetical protein
VNDIALNPIGQRRIIFSEAYKRQLNIFGCRNAVTGD